MNRTTLIFAATVLLAIFTTSTAAAEDAALGGVGIKLGGGLTSVAFSGDVTEEGLQYASELVDNDTGLAAGIQFILPINDFIAIQPELLIVNKGYAIKADMSLRVTENFNYVELPVLVSLRLPLLRAFTPKLLVGPQVSYLLGGSSFFDQGSSRREVDHEPSDYNPVDFGATIGVGADIGLDEFTLNVEARYSVGFTGVDAREGAATTSLNTTMVMFGLLI